MDGLASLLEHFSSVPVVVWLNEFFCRVERDGRKFEKSKLFRDNQEQIQALIRIPEVRKEILKYASTVQNMAIDSAQSVGEATDLNDDEVAVSITRLRRHIIEIEGDLAALLSLSQKQNAAAFAAASTSPKLVAGVGFEPTTFRL